MAKKPQELILAVDRAGLDPTLDSNGFHALSNTGPVATLESAGLWIGPRQALENNKNYLQIIPYIVLTDGSKIAYYTRGESGNEARLHGLVSIGLGGHVDLEDVVLDGNDLDLVETIYKAAKREVFEEVGLQEFSRQTWIGLLFDNSSDVGRVHIGVVGIWYVERFESMVIEDTIRTLTTAPLDSLLNELPHMETWSSYLLTWLSESDIAPTA